MRKIILQSQRLRISPLPETELLRRMENETDAVMRQAYAEMLDTMQALPENEEWGADWSIALTDGTEVGELCFMGAPDSDGRVVLGYGIKERFRRMGYATEAVKTVSDWALTQKKVREVTAQTEAENRISMRVLLKCGFYQDGFGEEGPLFRRGKETNKS